MSSAHDLPMTLFTLHGLAVSIRDRADTVTERSEAILVTSERLLTQQMKGEPIVLGIHPKQPSWPLPGHISAPRGAGLCPQGAQRAQRRPRL